MRMPVWAPTAARVGPVIVAAAGGPGIAWLRHGSIAAPDWLPFALALVALLLVASAAGALRSPTRASALAPLGLLGLAAWEAVTIAWAAEPNLARDEAVLTFTYAAALALAALLPADRRERLLALDGVVLVLGAYTVACALKFRFGAHPLFGEGRPADPVSYINAGAAIWALGFWPAVSVAARRTAAAPVRAFALATAGLACAGTIAAQSKGALLGLFVSTVVVFALAPRRTRLAVPAFLAAASAGAAGVQLTGPYRAAPAALRGAIHGVGTAMLLVAAGAAVVGALYTYVDRRWTPSSLVVRRTGGFALAAAVCVVVAGTAVGLGSHPVRKLQREWRTAHHSAIETSSTHLLALGSNRFDFWRVSIHGFREHPLFGIGARGFGPYYLVHGRSDETPARAHSLPLEVLLEDGLVGLLLLAVGLGAAVGGVALGARRRRVTSIAALGAATGALTQMCVDWTWTFPAVGIPLLVVVGLGLESRGTPLAARAAVPVAAVCAAAGILVLLPGYLAARISTSALSSGRTSSLTWAQRLDPLSPQPWLIRYELAPTAQAQLPYAQKLTRMQPRQIAYWYLLGQTLAAVGRKAEARDALRVALSLHPNDPVVVATLRRLQ